MSPSRVSVTLAFVISTLTFSTSAVGQEDPRKKEAAPFFEEGRRLAEKGQTAEALEKFKRAYAIYQSPNTLYNVARQEHLLHRNVEALRDYRQALRNPLLLPNMAELAKTYVAELERALGRLKITGRDGTRVVVAGVEYVLPLTEPIDIESGTIAVRTANDPPQTITVEVKAGALASAEIPEQVVTTAAAQHTLPPDVSPPKEEPHDGWSTGRIVTVSALGVASAGALVAGILFHSSANSSTDEAKGIVASLGHTCDGSSAPQCARVRTLESDRDKATSWSTISFVGAAVFAAGALTATFFWPTSSTASRKTMQPALSPFVTPSTAGADVAVAF